MARFVSSLHPRGAHGKFVRRGTGGASKSSPKKSRPAKKAARIDRKIRANRKSERDFVKHTGDHGSAKDQAKVQAKDRKLVSKRDAARSKARAKASPKKPSGPSRHAGKIAAVKKNYARYQTVKGIHGDIGDLFSHSARSYAYGATGNYVKSALHGAKASTAASRLGSQAAGAYVAHKKGISPAKKAKFYAAQAKFDKRVQAVDHIATIGLALSGSLSARKTGKVPGSKRASVARKINAAGTRNLKGQKLKTFTG